MRRPRLRGAVKAHVVTQQQLAHPVTSAHQVTANVLRARTRSRNASSRVLGHPDRMQPVDHQQPQQPLGVTPIGLDPVAGRTLDLARCRDHTLDAGGHQRPRERKPGRPGLIGHPGRARQRGAERHDLARLTRQPARARLPRPRDPSSPRRRSPGERQDQPNCEPVPCRHPHDCGRGPGHPRTLNPRTFMRGCRPSHHHQTNQPTPIWSDAAAEAGAYARRAPCVWLLWAACGRAATRSKGRCLSPQNVRRSPWDAPAHQKRTPSHRSPPGP